MLGAISATRRSEIDWLYRGVGRFFPAEWERLRGGAGTDRDDDLVAAYARLMENPDKRVRNQAARIWRTWEDVVLSWEPNARPPVRENQPDDDTLAFVRICAHYYAYAGWSMPSSSQTTHLYARLFAATTGKFRSQFTLTPDGDYVRLAESWTGKFAAIWQQSSEAWPIRARFG